MTSLELTLLYLFAAVIGVVLCRLLKFPPMLGYLVVGVLIGPNALALAQNSRSITHLAEFGIVFLMFVIGLEFNLPKLRSMRKHVLGLGLLQVSSTMLITTLALLILRPYLPAVFRLNWHGSLALSGALAMSSTAIVVKLMAERLELDSEHGKRIIGILLFQDLAVVPLLILIPALGAPSDELFRSLSLAFLKAIFVVTVLLVGGQHIMRYWLTLVAKRKSEELFMLNILLITLGLAWLTELAGLSLALGAFIAGILISETEFKHQVQTDIRPFHDILLGLFFITIGMMLNWRLVLDHWLFVLTLVVVPILFKFGVITILTQILGATQSVALRTGLYLAQAGEFGFVLLTLAQKEKLVSTTFLNPILASMVLSMIATPLIITYSNRIVQFFFRNDWMQRSLQMTNIAKKAIGNSNHVIICGYGRCGQNLARMLHSQSIAYIALDLDPDRVRHAAQAGDCVVYGDAVHLQPLMAAGLTRASAIVITYLDTQSALKVMSNVRSTVPTIPIIVRTGDDKDLELLRAAGATEVVPEAIEGSLMLASHALALLGVPIRRVIHIIQNQRNARYNLLRGYFHGTDDDNIDELHHERLASVTLPEDIKQTGMPLSTLKLDLLGVQAVSLRKFRGNVIDLMESTHPSTATSSFNATLSASTEPLGQVMESGNVKSTSIDPILEPNDTLVLLGTAEALALAENKILKRK